MSFDEGESTVSNHPYDQKIKIMVIGESLVGKTALITKYTKNTFGGAYLTTVGIDFQDKFLNINGKEIKIELWDTAGQERFRNIAKNYFQSSDGFLLVYDLTKKSSFEKLDFWNEQISLNAPKETKYILVGNKKDLEDQREVKIEEGEDFAKKNNIKFYETSAKDGTNVINVFETLAKEIVNDVEQINTRSKRSSQVLKKKNATEEKKSCC
jgi:small GTP-binding protein